MQKVRRPICPLVLSLLMAVVQLGVLDMFLEAFFYHVYTLHRLCVVSSGVLLFRTAIQSALAWNLTSHG